MSTPLVGPYAANANEIAKHKADTLILAEVGGTYNIAYPAITGSIAAGLCLSLLLDCQDLKDGEWVPWSNDGFAFFTGLNNAEIEAGKERLLDIGVLESRMRGMPPSVVYRLNMDRIVELLAHEYDRREEQEEN